MLVQRKNGQYIQADFFSLLGGLNNTDSPFRVATEQATSGYNYSYLATGGINKRKTHTLLNTGGVDSQANTLGMFVHSTSAASTKTVLRAAGTKLQTVNQSTGVCTTVTDDTNSAGSTAFSSTQPVCFSQFNTTSADTTWFAGGAQGSGILNGYYGSHYTKNGTPSPTSSGITTANNIAGTQNLATGSYYYAIAYKKAGTSAISNASNDVVVSVTNGGSKVVRLTFNLTSNDTTKYSSILIYRSAISGASGFTTGDLIGTVSSSTATFDDDGTVASAVALNIPRAANSLLDNSVLPSQTFNVVATWKRRLVTAYGSTIVFSDVNKPESWPAANVVTVPSGGDIKALGVIYFSTPTTAATDEYLVIFKEAEIWVFTGSNFITLTNSSGVITQSIDVTLKYVDAVGCSAQNTIVFAKGFLYWLDYTGFYLWDGSGKPVYLSRPIEFDFGLDGDFQTNNFLYASGTYTRRLNQIIWYVPSSTLGINYLAVKLDLRLTMAQNGVAQGLAGRILDGAFIKDVVTYPIYGQATALVNSTEITYGAGNDGRIWKEYFDESSENGVAVEFSYRTKTEDFGSPGLTKRYNKVIVWVRESSTNNLTLRWWTSYRLTTTFRGSKSLPMTDQVSNAYWDQASWDSAYWDQYFVTYTPLVFNLSDVEGDALTLEFYNNDTGTPITIAGYSILYNESGFQK